MNWDVGFEDRYEPTHEHEKCLLVTSEGGVGVGAGEPMVQIVDGVFDILDLHGIII